MQLSIAIGPLVFYITSVAMTIFVKMINKRLGEKVHNNYKYIIIQ